MTHAKSHATAALRIAPLLIALLITASSARAPSHAQTAGAGPGMGGMAGMGYSMGGGMGSGSMWGPGSMWGYGWMGPGAAGSQGFMAGCFMVTGENGAFPSLDERFRFLKSSIGITDAQAPEWDNYEAAVKRSLVATQAAWQTMMANMMSLNFAERFSRQLEALNAHIANLQQVMPALARVYGTLSPEQKARADGLFRSMGCFV